MTDPQPLERQPPAPPPPELPATGLPAGELPADRVAADRVAADRVAAEHVTADRVAAEHVTADRESDQRWPASQTASQAAPQTVSQAWAAVTSRVGRGVVTVLVVLVRGYQGLISPLLGPKCRFMPTCSEYFIQAVQKYGPLKGSWLGARRILRCHPWHPGGYDPP